MRLKREEFAALEINSWTDYNMDWSNPNPQDHVYWKAIYLAMKQRIDALNLWDDLSYIIEEPPYGTSMNRRYIFKLIMCLTELSQYFIDVERCKTFDFRPTFRRFELFNERRACGVFPLVFNKGKIIEKYPSFYPYLQNPQPAFFTYNFMWENQILIDLYNCLNEMTVTNGCWRNSTSIPNHYWGSFVGDDFNTMKQEAEEHFSSAWTHKVSYYKCSIVESGGFQEGYTLRRTDERGTNRGGVGVGVYLQSNYSVSGSGELSFYYDINVQTYQIRDIAIRKPSNMNCNLLQYTYVLDIENYSDSIEHTTNFFGYDEGFSVKNLGAFNGYLNEITIVPFSSLVFPSLPTTTEEAEKDITNGCIICVAFQLDYGIEGGFRFR